MATFYRLDGAKLTLAEYWRMMPNAFVFLVAYGMKLFGKPPRFRFAIPRPDRLFLVDLGELPTPAREDMEPVIRSLESVGPRLIFCHRLPVPEANRLGAAALLLDRANHTCLMVVFGMFNRDRELHLAYISRFADDSLGITTTLKKTLLPLPGFHIQRHPEADPRSLYELHQAHLERLAAEGLLPVPLQPEKLADFVLANELRYVDFHIARGVFVPMTDDDLAEVANG